MKLNDMKIGDIGKISKMDAPKNIKRRLMEVGFINGSMVRTVLSKKHIRAYMVKGAVIALRVCDTKNIEVEV